MTRAEKNARTNRGRSAPAASVMAMRRPMRLLSADSVIRSQTCPGRGSRGNFFADGASPVSVTSTLANCDVRDDRRNVNCVTLHSCTMAIRGTSSDRALRRATVWLLAFTVVFIVYASLYPFDFDLHH